MAQPRGRGARSLQPPSDSERSQRDSGMRRAAPPLAARPNDERAGFGPGGDWAGCGGARARHPEVGGGGGGECAAPGLADSFRGLAGLGSGAPGSGCADRARLLEGGWAGRTASPCLSFPFLRYGIESGGWVRGYHVDPGRRKCPTPYWKAFLILPADTGCEGHWQVGTRLAAGRLRVTGPGAAWSLQGGWAARPWPASGTALEPSHSVPYLRPAAGQQGDS